MNVYTYKGVVSITWIVNDNGKIPFILLAPVHYSSLPYSVET